MQRVTPEEWRRFPRRGTLEALIAEAKAHPSVEKMILFGSRARGDQEERADIDLALSCPEIAVKEWLDLLESLENLTLLKLDVHRMEEVGKSLREAIEKEGIILYERA